LLLAIALALCCGSALTIADTFLGTPGDDNVAGTPGPDQLYGDDGADTLDGMAGNDYITGGTGGDTISAGSGDDKVDGRAHPLENAPLSPALASATQAAVDRQSCPRLAPPPPPPA